MSKPESAPPVPSVPSVPPAPGPESPAVDLHKPAHEAEPADQAEQVEQATAPVAPAAPAPANPWSAPTPSLAPPQPPPPPLPAGGWASVPPAVQAGFQPGFYAPAAATVTNGFAVAALVTGLVAAAPVALVLGIVALVQINRRKERGFGMAVTGLVLGVVGTLLFSLALAGSTFEPDGSGRLALPPKAPAGSVAWAALKSGDCYNTPENGSRTDPEGGDETLYWVRRVPCSVPHHGEVAGTVRIPASEGPSYPGEARVRELAAELCRKVLDDYALDQWAIPDGMDDVYLYPTRGNWRSGDRSVTCAFEDGDAEHRGTVRTDRGSLNSAQLTYLEAVRGFNDTYGSQPSKGFAEASSEYRDWARRMAAASHAEAAALNKEPAVWPAEVKPTIGKLAAAQETAAAAWDAAAAGADLEGDVRRARALVTRTVPLSVEIRRGLGLSTGEQVPDLQV
ncbi:hypothetical protein P3T27_001936 [Kitasatospora sp. MAA19]|uniref:DUF4190 domain-containing protein n=1 Tax=Kitasatospora sp. MAA19 TaxID=3035090 RepID=UPI0024762CD7|nr:DUF4190 domain-containing protein [Kitasatospora sp. MAA19]MDH6705228.1 hypothetical protein [Kitasatospora sp. MAA19]